MDTTQLAKALKPVLQRVRHDAFAYRTALIEGWSKPGVHKRKLKDQDILNHLDNGDRVGVYPMTPGSSETRVAVLDLDDHSHDYTLDDILDVTRNVKDKLEEAGLETINFLSSSGHGVHMFVIWEKPQPTKHVRKFISDILQDLGYSTKHGSGGLSNSRIELFPKQDSVANDGYGNQFWLPLSGKSKPLNDNLEILNRKDVVYFDWPVSTDVPEQPDLENVNKNLPVAMNVGYDRLREWFRYIMLDNGYGTDFDYWTWVRVGFALYNMTGGSEDGLALWTEFSHRGESAQDLGPEDFREKWNSFGRSTPPDNEIITEKYIEKMARAGGWVEDVSDSFEKLEETHKDWPVLERNENTGKTLATTSNLLRALHRPDLCGYHIGYDNFSDSLICAPYYEGEEPQWRAFRDSDYQFIKAKLEGKPLAFNNIPRQELRDNINAIASTDGHYLDLMQNWVMNLEWDGVPRIDRFFPDYFNTKDDEYTRAASAYVWTALAGRGIYPDVKADIVPVLVGDEGVGKSTALMKLVPDPDMFTEMDLMDKEEDNARKMRGVSVVELAELKGLNSRQEENILSFVARPREKWTPKYKEFATFFYRRCIFFGTTNYKKFLSPRTGDNQNRRWLPMISKRVDWDAIDRDRDQLWAEGRERFLKNGVEFETAENLGVYERPHFTHRDPWIDKVNEYIRNNYSLLECPEEDITGEGVFISNTQLYREVIQLNGRASGGHNRKLDNIMESLGFREAIYFDEKSNTEISGWVRYGRQEIEEKPRRQ